MSAIFNEEATATESCEAVPATPSSREVTPLDVARRMARRMLECARPNHESMLSYALVCSEWRRHGFHECTGPLFDEANVLVEVWWGGGLASPRGALSLENLSLVLSATSPT